jgi:hypothetical protein
MVDEVKKEYASLTIGALMACNDKGDGINQLRDHLRETLVIDVPSPSSSISNSLSLTLASSLLGSYIKREEEVSGRVLQHMRHIIIIRCVFIIAC